MDMKYSVVLNTLNTGDTGCSVWEHPHEVLQTIADAGYDGVDMDGEPDRIDRNQFNEVRDHRRDIRCDRRTMGHQERSRRWCNDTPDFERPGSMDRP